MQAVSSWSWRSVTCRVVVSGTSDQWPYCSHHASPQQHQPASLLSKLQSSSSMTTIFRILVLLGYLPCPSHYKPDWLYNLPCGCHRPSNVYCACDFHSTLQIMLGAKCEKSSFLHQLLHVLASADLICAASGNYNTGNHNGGGNFDGGDHNLG